MILGAVWIIYVTRRNYKPMEMLVINLTKRIQKSGIGLMTGKEAKDEFKMIESALFRLIEQSVSYRQRHDENQIFRERGLFLDVMKGNYSAEMEESWNSKANKLHSPAIDGEFYPLIVEIDQYTEFCCQYNARDQLLLKFVINSVINEIASNHRVRGWSEWMSSHQLCILCHYESTDLDNQQRLLELCKEVIVWVGGNLKFTVTIGLGPSVSRMADIAASYEKALHTLRSKFYLGENRVIGYWDAVEPKNGGLIDQLDMIRSFAVSFRAEAEKWTDPFHVFFDDLMTAGYRKENLIGFLKLFIFQLDRELREFSCEFQDIWHKEALPLLDQAVEQSETLAEVEKRFFRILSDLAAQLREWRESKGNKGLIEKVKLFIEKRYNDPNLSLNMLSGHFQINDSYLSRTFKEETGVKLIDYIVRKRVEEAKQLLRETHMPVQEIAEKVGYLHTTSFIRAFKKQAGATPGDFRRDA